MRTRVIFTAAVLFVLASRAETGVIVFESPRHVYERGEVAEFVLKVPVGGVLSCDVSGWLPADIPAEKGQAVYRVDTAKLRAGDYQVRARLAAGGEARFALTVAKQHDTERMPVWRWGTGGGDPAWWIQRGFTGAFLSSTRDPLKNPKGDTGTALTYRRLFDRATKYDYELGFYFYPLLSEKLHQQEDILALYPDGTRQTNRAKPYPLEPAAMAYAAEVAETWTAAFNEYPGLRHALLQSEWQSPYCVNETACERALKECGVDPRDFVKGHGGLKGPEKDDVVKGIVDDENPRYRFLKWWWERGHGTAVMNAEMARIIDGYAPELITWHEPYRLAPVRHSHRGLDCIGTWTYGYPDIKRLCYTRVLQAAARPEKMLVQQDITLFVYGRFAIPLDDSSAGLREDFSGSDPYFTAGPDYAKEALWLVMSQRPDILAFYSAGKLTPDRPDQDPCYASPDTFRAIGQICEELVRPYGPAILKSRCTPPETAVLLSAASTWFRESARLPGYPNEQILPFCTLLMMNHVPFDVVLEEDIAEGALDRYRLLVMPKADALPRSVYKKISAYLEAGGRVLADASLGADLPGAEAADYDFTHQLRIDGKSLAAGKAVTAEEDRAIMEGYAADLAGRLADIAKPASADTPRVLTNTLDGGAVRYAFFINDNRAYGQRFGEWKLRFEEGVPFSPELSLALDGRPVLYDVMLRKPVRFETKAGRAVFESRLPAARGKLIAMLPEAIAGLELDVVSGDDVDVTIRVKGESGNVIPGVLPLDIAVSDANGMATEWRRYTATEAGAAVYRFIPAVNDTPGEWTVRVTELIAGKSAEATVLVKGAGG
jgi:hypothetical protein